MNCLSVKVLCLETEESCLMLLVVFLCLASLFRNREVFFFQFLMF